MRTRILWSIAGLLSHIGGALFLLFAILPTLDPDGATGGMPSTVTLLLLVMSLLLFILGGYCSKRGGSMRWRLGDTGSMVGDGWENDHKRSGSSDDRHRRTDPARTDDREPVTAASMVYCPHCYTENEATYTFCENCAQKLQ